MGADLGKLDEYRDSLLEQWVDERVLAKRWLGIHIWFHLHSYADFANCGLTLQGYSVRESEDDVLLILKVREGDTPYVVFLGSSDTTHCMLKLKRQMRNGGLKLVPDRYR